MRKKKKMCLNFLKDMKKKTEKEIDNMNKNQLIHYSKQFLNRVNEIENYLDKYIQYKKGYKLSEEEELKINDYNSKLNKANDLLQEITAKYNKSKIFIEKNNSIIDQLNKENILLKKKLNDKITLEKLTYPSFLHKTLYNDNIDKRKIKQDLIDFETRTLSTKKRNEKNKYFNFDNENKNIYSNYTITQTNTKRPDSYRCSTYENNNTYNNKYNSNKYKNNWKNKEDKDKNEEDNIIAKPMFTNSKLEHNGNPEGNYLKIDVGDESTQKKNFNLVQIGEVPINENGNNSLLNMNLYSKESGQKIEESNNNINKDIVNADSGNLPWRNGGNNKKDYYNKKKDNYYYNNNKNYNNYKNKYPLNQPKSKKSNKFD
jgi:hypothetical protein